MKRVTLALATGLGLGYLPAPGTFGSLWGLLFVVQLSTLSPLLYGLTVLAFLALSVVVADQAEKDFGEDSPRIVIDEVIGMILAISFLPISVFSLALGFVLFRLLDIFKPFPIRWVENNVSGGFGVVMDDVVAGILANIILRIVLTLL